MASNNLTIVSMVSEQTLAFTSDRFLDKADMIGKQLQQIADDVVGTFFQLMAQRGKFIDVEKDTGDFSGSYPNISESLWDRKAKRGLVNGSHPGENRFYFFTGALEKSLLGAGSTQTRAILGRSTFRGLRSDKFSNKRTVFRYGKGSVVNGEKVGGLFGRIADISTTVEIDLFSKVNTAADVPGLLSKSSENWAKKLAGLDQGHGGRRPIPARPLVARYFSWFVENEIPKQFTRKITPKKWRSFDE